MQLPQGTEPVQTGRSQAPGNADRQGFDNSSSADHEALGLRGCHKLAGLSNRGAIELLRSRGKEQRRSSLQSVPVELQLGDDGYQRAERDDAAR